MIYKFEQKLCVHCILKLVSAVLQVFCFKESSDVILHLHTLVLADVSEKESGKYQILEIVKNLRARTSTKRVIPFSISIKVAHILNYSNTGHLPT